MARGGGGRRRTQYVRDNAGRFSSTPGGGPPKANPAAVRKAAQKAAQKAPQASVTGSLAARSAATKARAAAKAASMAAQTAKKESRRTLSVESAQGTIRKTKDARAKLKLRKQKSNAKMSAIDLANAQAKESSDRRAYLQEKQSKERAARDKRIRIQEGIDAALKRGPSPDATKRFGPAPAPPPKPNSQKRIKQKAASPEKTTKPKPVTKKAEATSAKAKEVNAANKITKSPRRIFSDVEKAYAEIKSQRSKFNSDKKVREELARRGFDLKKYSSDNTSQGGLIKVALRLREKVAPKIGKKNNMVLMSQTERDQFEKIVRQRIRNLGKTGAITQSPTKKPLKKREDNKVVAKKNQQNTKSQKVPVNQVKKKAVASKQTKKPKSEIRKRKDELASDKFRQRMMARVASLNKTKETQRDYIKESKRGYIKSVANQAIRQASYLSSLKGISFRQALRDINRPVKKAVRANQSQGYRPGEFVRGNLRPQNVMSKSIKQQNLPGFKPLGSGSRITNAKLAVKWLQSQGYMVQATPRKKHDFAAAASLGAKRLLLNPLAAEWSDPRKESRKSRAENKRSSLSPMHILWHEIGHTKDIYAKRRGRLSAGKENSWSGATKGWRSGGISEQLSGARNENRIKKVATRVSKYATQNPSEFIAEVYAGIKGGRKFDYQVMSAYREAKGLDPNPIQRRIKTRKKKSS